MRNTKAARSFTFLTAFDDNIIAWIFGFLMQIFCAWQSWWQNNRHTTKRGGQVRND